MAVEPIFLDTSLLIAVSVEVHPVHVAATRYVAARLDERVPFCISPQICREFHCALTRNAVVADREFSVDEVQDVLEEWSYACMMLDENDRTADACAELIRRHEVRGKQVHDCNIVAVMMVHRVKRLATLNQRDFRRYDRIRVESILA